MVPVDEAFCAPPETCVYRVTSHADVRAVVRGSSFILTDSHVVVANEAEAIALTGMPDAAAAAVDLSRRADTAVVTLGPLGALAASRGAIHQVPAPKTEVRDTTGAGDLFVAAYVWADLAGLDLRARLQWATLYASRSLSTVTAFAGAATLRELLDEGNQLGFSLP